MHCSVWLPVLSQASPWVSYPVVSPPPADGVETDQPAELWPFGLKFKTPGPRFRFECEKEKHLGVIPTRSTEHPS